LRLVAGGWFVLREKYCWLVADKPSEQGVFQTFAGSCGSKIENHIVFSIFMVVS
jgi:hypothetical protein